MPSDSTVFVDTNVLLYAHDQRDPRRCDQAQAWITACWQGRRGRLSVQVLNELYANLRRVAPRLSVDEARNEVRRYRAWDPPFVDDVIVDTAWELQDRFSLGFWDALIVASAREQGCTYLLTEDLQHEQRIDSVQVVNPFVVGPELLGAPA
jgi:predicted nucleic acid-binding protein